MKSLEIWNKRYEEEPGLGSGTGSKGFLLSFKVNLLNKFVEENGVSSVLDFGHGDLAVANSLNVDRYIGIDIFDGSSYNTKGLKIQKCKFDEYDGESCELVTCLDVLYHILEDEQEYMRRSLDKMVEKCTKFLIVYAHDSLVENRYSGHLYDSKWLQHMLDKNEVSLKIVQRDCLPGTSAKFFIFQKVNDSKQERS